MQEKLKEILEDKYEEEIKRVINEFAGMISRESAIRILAHENKLIKNEKKNVERVSDILDMKDENNISRSLDVNLKLFKTFQKLETKSHVLQRIMLIDDEGKDVMCVLWDEKINEFEMLMPEEKDLIEIKNAYLKNDEIHVGKYSKINITKEKPILPLSRVTDGVCNVGVKVLEDVNFRTFTKNNEEKRMGITTVGDKSGKVRCVFWGDVCEKIDNVIKGDIIILNKAMFRNAELHVNEYTEIKINPPNFFIISEPEEVISGFEGSFEGKIIAVNIINDKNFGAVRTENRDIKVLFSDEIELETMKEKEISPDIDYRTVIYLHLRSLLGNKCVLSGYMNKDNIFNCKLIKKIE
jgi:hypothetical protein